MLTTLSTWMKDRWEGLGTGVGTPNFQRSGNQKNIFRREVDSFYWVFASTENSPWQKIVYDIIVCKILAEVWGMACFHQK